MAIIKIEFWNSCDFAGILYQTDWKQRLWVDTEISRPEYPIEIDTNKDTEGNEIPEFQRWQKRYKFKIAVTEPLADALTLATLCDNIYITDKYGDIAKVMPGSWQVKINWKNDCIAEAEIQFDVDYVSKTNCCKNYDISCFTDNVEPVIQVITDSDPIYLDPVNQGIENGDRYIVTNSHYLGGQIYYYSYELGEWVSTNSPAGSIALNLDDGCNYYYDGENWYKAPSIRHAICEKQVNNLTGTYIIKGFSYPNTFVKLYYKCFEDTEYKEWGEILTDSEFFNNGFSISMEDMGIDPCECTLINFYISSYSHGCNYGQEERDAILAESCGCKE